MNWLSASCVAVLLCVSSLVSASAKELRPGFDAAEYLEVLQRCAGQGNRIVYAKVAPVPSFKKVYSSGEVGLHNKWELWLSKDSSTIAINLRGTVPNMDNGLENVYAGMVPAEGVCQLSDMVRVPYKFAADKRAAVHAGWTYGVCSLIPDIEQKVIAYCAIGVRNIIVEGHSQGGAMAFLLSSYLHYRIKDGHLPADIVMKTYCSAAPKPGNQYYAHDYNYMHPGGWSLTVVSSLDWVAEVPFTAQRFSDINEVSPFNGKYDVLKKVKWPVRAYVKHVYRRMNRPMRKSQKRMERYLGHKAFKFVRRFAPEAGKPDFVASANYVPAGMPVVLMPDDSYYKQFAQVKYNIFMHHFYEQYYYLVRKQYMGKGVTPNE